MPTRNEVLLKILRSTTCPDEKPIERPALRCYDVQSRLSDDIGRPKIRDDGADVQTVPHPPVQRLYGTHDHRQPCNRFAQELFLKYPFMMPKVERATTGQYGWKDPVGITTYKGEFRNPREVIEEMETTDLVRSCSSEWQPPKETLSIPGRDHRGGTKIYFVRDELRSRMKSKQNLNEEFIHQEKKGPEVYPMTTEYRDNINSMANLIIKKEINEKDRALVVKQHTLPEYAREG